MTWKECENLIRDDYVRLPKRKWGMLSYLITNHSFKLTFWFRICSYLKGKGGLCNVVLPLVWIIYKHYQFKTVFKFPYVLI